MADELDVKCPACGHLTRVTSIAAGRQARCQCGFTFLIPDAASEDIVEDAFEADVEGYSGGHSASGPALADESGVPSRSTFHPSPEGAASGTERDGDPLLPEDIESLLDPDEVVWYSEQPPVKAVFVRISTRLLAIGAPLMVFFLGAAVAENGGGICLGITGLGVLGCAMVEMYLGLNMPFYTITHRRTVVRRGRLAGRISLLPHDRIVMVTLETGVVERVSSTRTIRLHTSAAARGGLLLANSAQAERVVRLLNQARPTVDELL